MKKKIKIIFVAAIVTIFIAYCGLALAQHNVPVPQAKWQNFSLPASSMAGYMWTANVSDREGTWIVVTSPHGTDLLKVYYKSKSDKEWKPLSACDRDGRKWNIVCLDLPLKIKIVNLNKLTVNYKVYPVPTIIPVH